MHRVSELMTTGVVRVKQDASLDDAMSLDAMLAFDEIMGDPDDD